MDQRLATASSANLKQKVFVPCSKRAAARVYSRHNAPIHGARALPHSKVYVTAAQDKRNQSSTLKIVQVNASPVYLNSRRLAGIPPLNAAASVDGGAGGDSAGGNGNSGGSGKITSASDGDEGKGEDEDTALSLEEVQQWMAKHNVQLPADMLQIAAKFGLRQSVLTAYLSLKDGFFTGYFLKNVPWVRDRLLADHRFLFKVVAEVLIDSGCATVAEIRKRGDDFWREFEFYVSDLIVGCVLDVALVGLMAPAAILGGVSRAAQASSPLQRWLAGIPSAVFAASVPGAIKYSVGSRLACLGVKFCEYSLAGMVCGFVGQGLANSLMLLRRHFQGESDDDVPVPPLVTTALVWGLFMGVSANIRYQTVFGLERLVDLSIAKYVPAVAYGTTIGIRFVNNVIGGENFIDMARWAGVQ